MKQAADDASGAPPLQLPNLPMPPAGATPPIPPPPMPPAPVGPPAGLPPASMPPPMPPAGTGPMGAMPMQNPAMGIDPKHIETFTQDDGTIVGFVPTPDGGQHIVGVHPPFKLPKGQKPGAGPAGVPPMDLSRAALPMQ